MHPILFEVFESLPRQGPGDHATTARALELCPSLPDAPRVLDLGCGAGAQTLDLLSLTRGTVTAVDAHAPFIERLRRRAAERGVAERVDARVADMTRLDPQPHDLVWSEGALYNLGLARALDLCATQLVPGGTLAFTDAVWRSDNPPDEVRTAFADYTTMGHPDDVLALLDARGWSTVAHFHVPEHAWWTDFYTPMEARIDELRRKHASDAEALAALDALAEEPRMRHRHAAHYGYAFFVATRP